MKKKNLVVAAALLAVGIWLYLLVAALHDARTETERLEDCPHPSVTRCLEKNDEQ